MRRLEQTQRRPVGRRWGLAAAAVPAALLLSGCVEDIRAGFLPEPITSEGSEYLTFWNGTWIAAWAIGIFMWGLIFWCVIAYRRKSEDEIPTQFRYHVPFEILYTAVPILLVMTLFGQTVKVENTLLHIDEDPDVVVNVAGKKWSWDFNYLNEDVYETGVQAYTLNEGREGVPETLPTLVLPVDSRVEFVLTSRDVIHSFWVPQFLIKLDMIPGRVNIFQVTTTEEGTFHGKCAELCGTYHAEMLFNVSVVSQEEYDAHIESLREAGQTGRLGPELDQYELQSDQDDPLRGRSGN
ncbi:aa3-type cytochrome oxidase subunit II [Ornithinimicrobium sufpigmenti]|uniref:aa3-type cytochrome oxidase subunit II n=1 Tax=Ornithinimicrobium sufpigmenti TaxID=2508882 RepID=UPI001035841E|nr:MULTISPECIES: cytochrome c oxidase subunit II [unclassified Ornithinimicrobium]